MREIEKEDLIKQLQKSPEQSSNLDMDAVDFVLLKLNELRYEVGLRVKEKERKIIKKNVS